MPLNGLFFFESTRPPPNEGETWRRNLDSTWANTTMQSPKELLRLPNQTSCLRGSGQLFYFRAVFYGIDKNLGRFKTRNVMFLDDDGGIARNVACHLPFALLVDKTAKASHINIVAVRHAGFNNCEEGFHGSGNIGFVNPCFFCDLIKYICFSHG